jgi:AraC-like DNA-binding protein
MSARVRIVEEMLVEALRQNGRRDCAVERCVQLIENAREPIAVAELASMLGLSSRQFARRFQNAVGFEPKGIFAREQIHSSGAPPARAHRRQSYRDSIRLRLLRSGAFQSRLPRVRRDDTQPVHHGEKRRDLMASDFYNSSGSVWPKITGHEQHAHTSFRKSIIVLANPILQRLGPN